MLRDAAAGRSADRRRIGRPLRAPLAAVHGAALRRDRGGLAEDADRADPEVRAARPAARGRNSRRRRSRRPRPGRTCRHCVPRPRRPLLAAHSLALARSHARQAAPVNERPTRELAAFAAGLTLDAIPRPVVEHAKRSLLDTAGCGLQGSTLEWSRIAQRVSAAEGASRAIDRVGHAAAYQRGAGGVAQRHRRPRLRVRRRAHGRDVPSRVDHAGDRAGPRRAGRARWRDPARRRRRRHRGRGAGGDGGRHRPLPRRIPPAGHGRRVRRRGERRPGARPRR